MHFSIPTIALFAAASAAVPNPVPGWKDVYIAGADSRQKREVGSGPNVVARTETPKARFIDHYFSGGADPDDSGLATRDKKRNFVSSCKGDKSQTNSWVTKGNFDNGSVSWNGWNKAVEEYCYHITHSEDNNPTHIGPKDKYQSTQPYKEGRVKTIGGMGVEIEFEIHNHRDSTHTPTQDNCVSFFKAISNECGDTQVVQGKSGVEVTRGGTYQIGESEVSYHAFINVSEV